MRCVSVTAQRPQPASYGRHCCSAASRDEAPDRIAATLPVCMPSTQLPERLRLAERLTRTRAARRWRGAPRARPPRARSCRRWRPPRSRSCHAGAAWRAWRPSCAATRSARRANALPVLFEAARKHRHSWPGERHSSSRACRCCCAHRAKSARMLENWTEPPRQVARRSMLLKRQ